MYDISNIEKGKYVYSGYKYFGGRQTCPNIPRQVAFLFADPLSTAVVEKGLTSRGLSVEKARKLVNNERRMRCLRRMRSRMMKFLRVMLRMTMRSTFVAAGRRILASLCSFEGL